MTTKGDEVRNKITEFMKSFEGRHGYWPRPSEIMAALRMSKTNIHTHLNKLIESGRVENPARSVYKLNGKDDEQE